MALDARPANARCDPAEAEQPVRLSAPAPGLDLFFFALARSPGELAAMSTLLAPAEHARAARFGRPALRDRYIAGRAMLRRLLGERLAMPPESIQIRRGHRGRPQVEPATALDFNVSHTGGYALIGIASSGRIGVDIEHEGRTLNVDGVARKFMAPGEQAMLATLTLDQRRRTLLRLWTCKEAMSKATGDALSAPFRHIEIALDGHARVLGGPTPYVPHDWTLHAIRTPGDHLAAIALWKGS